MQAQREMRMSHIVICGISDSYYIFPHYLLNGSIFEKELLNLKCAFWFSLSFCLHDFSF